MDDGRLGFTRELYNYYFDYKLPVGKSVHVEIVTSVQEATLKIDGEAIGTARGSFYNVDAGKVTKEGINQCHLYPASAAHRVQDAGDRRDYGQRGGQTCRRGTRDR